MIIYNLQSVIYIAISIIGWFSCGEVGTWDIATFAPQILVDISSKC